MMLSEMPVPIQERQPVELFVSTFMGKTDSMMVHAKRFWTDKNHAKHFPGFAARLQQLDVMVSDQLKGQTTVDDLNVPMGFIAHDNVPESFIMEALLLSLKGDQVYHVGHKTKLPYTKIFKTLFDGIHIVEDRKRIHNGSAVTDVYSRSSFSLVGKNHLPQQYMEEVLRQKPI